MIPRAVSTLYYSGAAITFVQFVCVCINLGFLPHTLKPEQEDPNKKPEESYQDWLLGILVLACLTGISWGFSFRNTRPALRFLVGSQVTMSCFLAFIWTFVGAFSMPTRSTPTGAVMASCLATHYRSIGCVALIAHLFFPCVTIAILLITAQTLYHISLRVHGSAQVLLPPAPLRYASAWTPALLTDLNPPAPDEAALPPPPAIALRVVPQYNPCNRYEFIY
ncbi:hypothetical protein B0H17DRAFT_1204338 [Mycena rosella]|uniref:Uncharacterized protein n=1 Tax=Mycena rosella TaxID=1033263 RepID=A0AAD7GBA0_MYCRO|nr:hypothetical protein B0H17DRAFT_1204338 [Mycena rosella]